jgi:hypothetical protein
MQAGNYYAWSPFRAIIPCRSRMGYALADREVRSVSEARSYGEPARPRVDQATAQLLAALMWA